MRTNRILVHLLVCVTLIGCFWFSSAFGASSDKYEPDNTMETARLILENPMLPDNLILPGYEWKQSHNFYANGDEDWVYFYGRHDEIYTITAKNVGKKCDPVIEIYNSKKEKVREIDDYMEGESEYAEFRCEADDTYYARIRQCDLKNSACHASYGDETQYSLILFTSFIPNPGVLELNNVTIGVPITLNMPNLGDWKITPKSQTIKLTHSSGTFTLSAMAQGYETCCQQVTIKEGATTSEDICLKQKTSSVSVFPTIGSVSPPQNITNTTSAKIYADNVIDSDGIKKVWALITPPNYVSYSADTPVISLPTVDLKYVGNNRYEATYDKFIAKGTYRIVIFATDNKDFTSIPEEKHITSVTQTQGSSCVFVSNDLYLNLCAEYLGKRYGCTLKPYPNPSDPQGLYWKLDVGTFRVLQDNPGNCVSIGNDLKLNLCAEYLSMNYGFSMNLFPNPNDTGGLYWKMDVGTFREIR